MTQQTQEGERTRSGQDENVTGEEFNHGDPAWGSPDGDERTVQGPRPGRGRFGGGRGFGPGGPGFGPGGGFGGIRSGRGRGFGPGGGFGPGRGFGRGFGAEGAEGARRGAGPDDFPDDDDARDEFRGPGPFHGGPGGHGGHGGRRGFGPRFGPGGFGPGGFGPGGFGPGGFGRGGWGPGGDGPGRGGRGGRGGRRPRGNVRAAILALLDEEPRQGYHGYAIMNELNRRSGGLWRPSPGSVYPVLQQLQDEGLIKAEDAEGGRKVFSITDAGHETVRQSPSEYAEPWAMAGPGQRQRVMTLFEGMGALGQATQQIAQLGSDAQVERAREALDEARRRIYRILAEDESADPAPTASGPSQGDPTGTAAGDDQAGRASRKNLKEEVTDDAEATRTSSGKKPETAAGSDEVTDPSSGGSRPE